jgi:hypothetical protein
MTENNNDKTAAEGKGTAAGEAQERLLISVCAPKFFVPWKTWVSPHLWRCNDRQCPW